MTPDQLTKLLRAASAKRPRDVDAIAETLSGDVNAPLATAVEHWLGEDEELSAKALSLLAGVEELAVRPLLDVAHDRFGPREQVWLLRTAVAVETSLRNRVVRRLDAVLKDKTPCPLPREFLPVEPEPPPRRVCDEAYLLLRELLNTPESTLAGLVNAEAFLNLPEELKDEAIEKARRSRVFTRFTGDDL